MIERQSIRVEGRRLVEISQVQYEEQPLTEQTVVHVEVCLVFWEFYCSNSSVDFFKTHLKLKTFS